MIPVDSGGRRQPLLSAWNADALRRILGALGDARDRSVRDLTERAHPVIWVLGERETALIADIDTATELRAARARADDLRLADADDATHDEGTPAMEEWIQAVRLELGLDDSVDVDVILDVARVAAHNRRSARRAGHHLLAGRGSGTGCGPAESTALVSALLAGSLATGRIALSLIHAHALGTIAEEEGAGMRVWPFDRDRNVDRRISSQTGTGTSPRSTWWLPGFGAGLAAVLVVAVQPSDSTIWDFTFLVATLARSSSCWVPRSECHAGFVRCGGPFWRCRPDHVRPSAERLPRERA